MIRKRAPRELQIVGLIGSLAFAFPGIYLIWRNFTTGADPLGLLLACLLYTSDAADEGLV